MAEPVQASGRELLDADVLPQLRRLGFASRGHVAGTVSGLHRSRHKGFSSEFAEHREYSPGDDLRRLDWRVYARTDRHYLKQFHDETNLRATLALDVSGSMAYTGERATLAGGSRLSKLDYGRRLAAGLAYVLIAQQDAAGLALFDRDVCRYVPARSRRGHLRVLLEGLGAAEAGVESDLAPVLHGLAETVPGRGVFVLISDMLGDLDELIVALQHLCFKRHEVILFHVLAEEETTFPFDRPATFADLEGVVEDVAVDPRALRAAYLEGLARLVDGLEGACGRMRIDYVQVSTRRPVSEALAGFLAMRRSGGRAP